MNKEQSKVLIEAIKKLINTEVAKQLSTMKVEITRQILAEVKRQTKQSSVQNLYSGSQPKMQSSQPKIYSSNPLLNEVMMQTQMNMKLLEGQHEEILDDSGKILNVSTQGPDGQHIDFSKPAVQSVLEAMNKNYSDFVDIEPERPKQVVQKPVQPVQRPNVDPKNYVQSMQSISDEDLNDGTINIPDPFNEKEW